MRILIINDHAHLGGAAIAARRLALGYSKAGHDVRHAAGFENGDADVIPLRHFSLGPLHSYAPVLSALPANLKLTQVLRQLKPDIIHVHNLHGCIERGFGPAFIHSCMKYAPTVWTLHDMWSFTGRCAYRGGCEKHLQKCDASCETHQEYPNLKPSLIPLQFAAKAKVIAESGVVGVAPSKWMQTEGQAGLWKAGRLEHIQNGIPEDIFNLEAREPARRALGLSPQQKLLCFSAANLSEPRKGAALLWQALQLLDEHIYILVIGQGPLPSPLPKNVTLVAQKNLTTEQERAAAFSAADLTLHPALDDNLPNTIAESLCCGTPVVGFSLGGVAEMLAKKDAGLCAEHINASAFADKIKELYGQLSSWDRKKTQLSAHHEYALRKQSDRYLQLFKELLKTS